MAVRTVIPADPHRLKALRGPEQRLVPHPGACSLEDLPAHVDALGGSRPLAVDLFCGAGGLSLGLHAAGFEVILGADIRPDSIATHRHHFSGCSHQGDLSDPQQLMEIISQLHRCGDIALVAGGPPCQPFSRNIRWRKHDLTVSEQHRELNSGRRELWESFMSVVEAIEPRAFLMENVPDIALTGDQEIFRNVVSRAERAGYRVHARIIYAWQYGVPQLRPRLFVAGTHRSKASPLLWPEPEYPSEQSAPTLKDAIGDLPPLTGDWWEEWQDASIYPGPTTTYQQQMRNWLPIGADLLPDHITRRVREDDLRTFQLMRTTRRKYHELAEDERRYRVTSRAQRNGDDQKESGKEHSFGNKYNILQWGQPCITITAHMSKDGYWYIHPVQDRTLSIREAARVQSFPDGFRFHGTPSNRFHQVGEAVAPLVAKTLGTALLASVKEEDTRSDWRDPQGIRERLRNEVSNSETISRLPWAAQLDEEGKEIPEKVRAWRVILGELLVSEMDPRVQQEQWPNVLHWWQDHEGFLADDDPRQPLRTLSTTGKSDKQCRRKEELLRSVAEHLRDDLPWSEWVRTDLPGLGRDRIRQCLAMVGITADRSCSVPLGRMVGRVMGIPDLSDSGSRQLRELHLGLMLGHDQGGDIYRAAVAVADGWCAPAPRCEVDGNFCPMLKLCCHAQRSVDAAGSIGRS